MMFFPTDLTSFLDIIRQNKEIAYTLIFGWASSHSLLLTLFAGYASSSGVLQFGTLIAVCWFGSFVGDILRFWLGRKFGARLLSRFPLLESAVTKAALLSERHYIWMILAHRYPHGIRGIAAIAYGISKLQWGPFLLLNVIASGIWAAAIVSVGYAFGQVSEKLMSDASNSLGLIMLVLFLGLSWVLSRRFDAMVEQTAAAEKAAKELEEREAKKRERQERQTAQPLKGKPPRKPGQQGRRTR